MNSHHCAFHRARSLRWAVLAAMVFAPAFLGAQSSAGKQSPASSDSAPAAAGPSGNASIETEMLSYDAMNQIAHEIAARISKTNSAECGQKVLSQDASTVAQLTAYGAFDATTTRLLSAYQQAGKGFVAGGAASDALTEATGIMTAIRSTAVYTSQTFQPTTASMSNLLAIQLGKLNPQVEYYSAGFPGDILSASKYINKRLADVDDAQSKIDSTKRKDSDAVYNALKTQLASASADGTLMATVIKGRGLSVALQTTYCVLNYSVDGTGGGTRVSHPFLWEVILPSPSPSYTGGAIVSFVYSTRDGKFLTGDSLRYLYGYSKLGGPKMKTASNFDRQ